MLYKSLVVIKLLNFIKKLALLQRPNDVKYSPRPKGEVATGYF